MRVAACHGDALQVDTEPEHRLAEGSDRVGDSDVRQVLATRECTDPDCLHRVGNRHIRQADAVHECKCPDGGDRIGDSHAHQVAAAHE